MRFILKWISGLVVLLALIVGGLWLAGQREHAGRHAGSVDVLAPASEVFPWLVDVERRKQWQQGLTEVTPLDGRGPVQGARSRERVVIDERVTDMDVEIAVYEPPHRLIVTTHADGDFAFDYEVRWQLSESAGVTTVSCVCDGEYHGALTRLLEPLIALAANGQLDADLRLLAQLVEASPQGLGG